MNIADLIKQAKQDATLLPSINATELLKSLESVKNDFLENETINSISKNVLESLVSLNINAEIIEKHYNKLAGYRFVDELHLLHRGKYVRWIRHDAPEKLIKGAVVVDIQFGDFGTNVLCRLMTGDFLKYRFDKCNTYQKLTNDEQFILLFSNHSSLTEH
jgi:hypothetical protein